MAGTFVYINKNLATCAYKLASTPKNVSLAERYHIGKFLLTTTANYI